MVLLYKQINNYPWRCLNRGFFLFITYNLPFLRTMMQSTLLFLIAGFTFISFIFYNSKIPIPSFYWLLILFLFIPICYSSFSQIVRRHFNFYFITGKNFNIIHSHLSRDVGYYFVPVFKFHTEHCI